MKTTCIGLCIAVFILVGIIIGFIFFTNHLIRWCERLEKESERKTELICQLNAQIDETRIDKD